MSGATLSSSTAQRAVPAQPRRGPADIVPFSPASRPPSPSAARFMKGARAVIFKPSPSATQSGRATCRDWVLEFEPVSRPTPDPLMGWWGGGDPLASVRLRFPSRESAEQFARRQGLDWTVVEHAPRRPAIGIRSRPDAALPTNC